MVSAALSAGVLASVAGYAEAGDVLIVTARTADSGGGARTGDGRIDAITLTFSAPMTNSTPKQSTGPGDPGFRVDGYAIDENAPFAWESNNTTLRINLVQKVGMDTGATPTVRYDAEGGLEPVSGEVPTSEVQALDGAGPVLKSFSANDQGGGNMFNAIGDEARIAFSEPAAIAGATPLDRWTNLERFIRFTQDAGGVGCSRDGVGVPTDRNFPQPGAAGDPIVEPTTATDHAQTFIVRQRDATGSSPGYTFAAIPSGCWAGVDEQFFGLVTDQGGNVARHEGEPGAIPSPNARRVRINPTDAEITAVKTVDSAGSADGRIDGLEVHVNQNVDDATLAGALGAFTIELDGVGATPTSIASGTANDRIFTIRFSSDWSTGKTPTLEYTKPSGCTSTAGTGVKSTLPSPGWRACLATFSTVAADAAPPVIKTSRTRDADGDGILDRVRASFSEEILEGAPAGWEVAGQAATAFTIDANDRTKADIDFPEAPTPDSDALPTLKFTGTTSNTDAAGNRISPIDTTVSSDGAAPRIVRGYEYDTNSNGRIEHAVVEFSEPVAEPASGAAARLAVGGKTASFASPVGDDPGASGDEFLTLGFSALDGTAPGDVVYTAGSPAVADLVGNAATAQTVTGASLIDRAIPIGDISIEPNEPVTTGTSTVSVDFSETMDPALAPTVTFAGKAVNPVVDLDHNLQGWRTTDGSIWEGTVAIVAADCAVATGCPATATAGGAKDLAGNAQTPASLDTEVDTIAPTVAALTGFEVSGGAAPPDVVNMFTDGFSLGATVEPGHAEGGTAELLVDGASLSPAAKDMSIGATDADVRAATAFADRAALQAAVDEGARALTIKLCDDARNCTTSGSTHAITADFTPVSISLVAPAGGDEVRGGSMMPIEWNGDELAADFDHIELHYSADGGSRYRTIDDAVTTVDGNREWKVPAIRTVAGRVRVTSVDLSLNRAHDPSDLIEVDVTADVDGDGSGDVIIGAPGETLGRATGAGAVHVIRGGTSALTSAGNQVWSQDTAGIAGAAESGDAFGAVLARGDFDGDGRTDAAIAAPGENAGAGLVHVLYGVGNGLSSARSQVWWQNIEGIADVAESGDRFGDALAVSDFDGDGYADLVIGAPGENGGKGLVHVLYGSSSGLSAARSQVWTQDSPGVLGGGESGDRFGQTLAAADIDGDGYGDIAIGVPLENLGSATDAGMVNVLYGSSGGIAAAGNQAWTQSSPGLTGGAESNDRWSETLAADDFDADGYADLAIGSPRENLGSIADAGSVSVLYGSTSGVSTRDDFWRQGSGGIAGATESWDRFGLSLATGDFDDDGFADLAVGVPLENIGSKSDVGVVAVLYGRATGLSGSGSDTWSQDSPGIAGTGEAGDRFGEALTTTDAGADGFGDLTVGAPGEALGSRAAAGLIHLLKGSASDLTATGSQVWHTDSSGIAGTAESGDRFGASLTA